MSSTRHAPEGSAIAYEKYMSSPEYAALRGIPGTAVAAKAQLCTESRERSLLFFLHALSIKEGGLRSVPRALLKSLPSFTEESLTKFLVELCINPKLELLNETDSAPGFERVLNALHDFQDGYEARVRSDFVLTTIGREIFETLDHALAIGKMVVIEGESGIGKTTAVDAWYAAHQGQARFISLSGITHKTGFFRKLAGAIGVTAAKAKAIDMQVRVEEFFRKTELMLIIDEAHYLWPQYQRSYSSPELIDWVNTALVNHNVPVALICTDQFAKLKPRVETQTGWTSEQLEHRVKRYKKLSSTPTKEDLKAVAARLLAMKWNSQDQRWNVSGPEAHPDVIKIVVGYALTCKMRLPAVSNTIEEARYQARKSGRSKVIATDIRTALLDYQIPSDEALEHAFEKLTSRSGNSSLVRNPQSGVGVNLQSRCNRIATALH